MTLVSSPDFPAAYKDEALAQGGFAGIPCGANCNQLDVCEPSRDLSGESEGPYRLGGDSFFTDANGRSAFLLRITLKPC